jgi:hypothetical protein
VSRRSWFLILGLALAVHNGEEWLYATDMLQFMRTEAPAHVRDFHAGITVSELQGSLLILTALAFLGSAVAAAFPNAVASVFGMMVLAAVLALNAIFHIVLSMLAGAYNPGLVTALLISLPLSITLLVRARQQRWVSARAFWFVVPAALLVHGPVLDVLFRWCLRLARASHPST